MDFITRKFSLFPGKMQVRWKITMPDITFNIYLHYLPDYGIIFIIIKDLFYILINKK